MNAESSTYDGPDHWRVDPEDDLCLLSVLRHTLHGECETDPSHKSYEQFQRLAVSGMVWFDGNTVRCAL